MQLQVGVNGVEEIPRLFPVDEPEPPTDEPMTAEEVLGFLMWGVKYAYRSTKDPVTAVILEAIVASVSTHWPMSGHPVEISFHERNA